jgi:hypothetical protein
MSTVLPEICHRTRQHVSLRLDTELSELERALAAAHLSRCAACQEFAVDIESFTETLRAAPLEEPSARFQLPHRPARFGVARAGTAAAAAITAAIAVSGFAGLYSSPSRISASDLQNAHDRMIVKERLIEAIDSTTTARPVKDVPRGVEAAKNANL